MRNVEVAVTVNGTARTARVEARTSLSDLLRHEFGLTGTHVACEQGVCGSCTVLLDDVPVRACVVLAGQVDGARVDTVESLAGDGRLSDLQQAMRESHGLQCGFCTPGVLMGLTYAQRCGLSEEEAVDQVLVGHLCRCTGYDGIRNAVKRCWRQREESAS